MIQLSSTSDRLQAVTGGSQTLSVHASWIDSIGTTVTPGRQNTNITSATTTTVVPPPAAGQSRDLKTLTLDNADPSTSLQVTVQHTDGSTTVTLIALTLPAGYVLTWTDRNTWSLVGKSGRKWSRR